MQAHKPGVCLLVLLCLLGLIGCGTTAKQKPTDLAVMSFNIRNGRANDGANHWDRRKPLVYGVIREHSPDLVGIQEAFRFQLDEIAENLPEYDEIGEGRGGGTEDEYSAILYRADRFTVDQSGTFWLSETPEVVSRHWNHFHYRICTWARLIDKPTGKAFYIFNTHFDHRSQLARINSAKLIATRIAEREHKDPVILTGDFNAGEDNDAVRYLTGAPDGLPDSGAYPLPTIALQDTFRVIHPDATVVGTGNGGYTGKRDGAKIDYIFITSGIETLEASIDQEPRDGRYPSDHYPVTARIRLDSVAE